MADRTVLLAPDAVDHVKWTVDAVTDALRRGLPVALILPGLYRLSYQVVNGTEVAAVVKRQETT